MYHGNRHRIAGGFLGNLGRGLLNIGKGVVGGFLTKGPIGAVVGAATAIPHAVAANVRASTVEAGSNPRSDAARLAQIKAQHAATVARSSPGGGGAAIHMGVPMMQIGAGGGGGGGGRRRRMHWTNTKALGRAERRIKSAVHHMTRYIKWVHAKKDGHAAPKFHRSKKR